MNPLSSETLQTSQQLAGWLERLGFAFDPFVLLDAATDPHLGQYLVGHQAFEQVWGDWSSWVFALPGGGKTALSVCTFQACWVGQETNHPFPIPYVPPYLSWGHLTPSLDEHLAALSRAGATVLLLALAHYPHWLFRMDAPSRLIVRQVLDWNLPGPLNEYLARCRTAGSVRPLNRLLRAAFTFPSQKVESDTVLEWCDELQAIPPNPRKSIPVPEERWAILQRLLLDVLGFHSVYILLDGLDAADIAGDTIEMERCLSPLPPQMVRWSEQGVFLKSFLPFEIQSFIEKQGFSQDTHIIVLHWTPDLLADVIRARVRVASEGAFDSLDAISSPALRDVEHRLAEASLPLPREILVLTRYVLETHVSMHSGSESNIQPSDLDMAIKYYKSHLPLNDQARE